MTLNSSSAPHEPESEISVDERRLRVLEIQNDLAILERESPNDPHLISIRHRLRVAYSELGLAELRG